MPRKSEFTAGTKSKHNVEYETTDHGDSIDVSANTYPSDPAEEPIASYGSFKYDPASGRHLVVPGTLDLDPKHAAQGVGQEMARMADIASARPIKNK